MNIHPTSIVDSELGAHDIEFLEKKMLGIFPLDATVAEAAKVADLESQLDDFWGQKWFFETFGRITGENIAYYRSGLDILEVKIDKLMYGTKLRGGTVNEITTLFVKPRIRDYFTSFFSNPVVSLYLFHKENNLLSLQKGLISVEKKGNKDLVYDAINSVAVITTGFHYEDRSNRNPTPLQTDENIPLIVATNLGMLQLAAYLHSANAVSVLFQNEAYLYGTPVNKVPRRLY